MIQYVYNKNKGEIEMGLDMFLFKVEKQPNKSLNDILSMQQKLNECELSVEEMKNNKDFKDSLSYIIKKSIGDFSYYTFLSEMVYWRKANAIHNWFVNNVQNYDDDCGYYKVHLQDLENLLDTLQTVHDSIKNKKLVDEYCKDSNGETYSIKVFLKDDTKIAEELLPTQEGFFFGSTKYGEQYLEEIEYTIKEIKNLIENFDFNNNYLVYNSSW